MKPRPEPERERHQRSRAAAPAPPSATATGSAPEAIGRRRLRGCSRSASTSQQVVEQVDRARQQRERQRSPPRRAAQQPRLPICCENSTPANSSRFLVHCLGRSTWSRAPITCASGGELRGAPARGGVRRRAPRLAVAPAGGGPAGGGRRGNSARSTSSHSAWPIAMCASWMCGVESRRRDQRMSHCAANVAALAPVMPITVMPRACASSTACRTFGEPPLVVIATSTSPGVPSASSWRENTCS